MTNVGRWQTSFMTALWLSYDCHKKLPDNCLMTETGNLHTRQDWINYWRTKQGPLINCTEHLELSNILVRGLKNQYIFTKTKYFIVKRKNGHLKYEVPSLLLFGFPTETNRETFGFDPLLITVIFQIRM